MKKGLMLFAREPLLGSVKTRLAAIVGDEAAVELYESMLQDVLKICRQLNDIESVVFWSCEEASLQYLADRYQCRSRSQVGVNLGERMQAAFEEMFNAGWELSCIIGSDAPDLPLSYIEEAYRLLATQQTDVVFGPSMDGGYYLIGMRRVLPELFADIPWSTADVLEQSLEAARHSGLRTALLPEWQDIDTYEDFKAFRHRNLLTSSMETT